jgi:hypothetical protein
MKGFSPIITRKKYGFIPSLFKFSKDLTEIFKNLAHVYGIVRQNGWQLIKELKIGLTLVLKARAQESAI